MIYATKKMSLWLDLASYGDLFGFEYFFYNEYISSMLAFGYDDTDDMCLLEEYILFLKTGIKL